MRAKGDTAERGTGALRTVNGHRINIFGASGCGASTAGRALAAQLAVPYFDSDDYYHEPTDPPFQKQRAPDARCKLLTADLGRTKGWVLAGGVAGWSPCPTLDFTLIVFLWVPTPVRIERLRRREFERFGKRILSGGDMHAAHEAFIDWASHYDIGGIEGKTLALHEALLAETTCPIVQIREAMPTAQIVDVILAAMK